MSQALVFNNNNHQTPILALSLHCLKKQEYPHLFHLLYFEKEC